MHSYDGKRVAPFREVAEALLERPGRGNGSIGHLVALAASEETALQTGATWVLKYLAERGVAPRDGEAVALLRLLRRPLASDALLHLLQTLPHMDLAADLPAGEEGTLHRALLRLIESDRVFVRAWAYNGLGLLAVRNAALRAEIEGLLRRAERTETAAVKVRVRHARAALRRQSR
ncbi:MAG: hypothetical protein F4Z31_07440 [Gemmatimonadetes bacterium]|nr:hypothetical protein [Gemmatimonadota bacterium]